MAVDSYTFLALVTKFTNYPYIGALVVSGKEMSQQRKSTSLVGERRNQL